MNCIISLLNIKPVTCRVNEDASWTRVWRSKRASRSLEPVFDVEIPLSRLCNGDIFCTLKLQIWDKKNDGDDLMGEVETSVETLLRAFNGAVRVDLLFDNKAVGYFVFLAAKIDLRPTFTEVSRFPLFLSYDSI